MNFKRISIVTVLAAAQVSLGIPVSAEPSAVPETEIVQIQPEGTVQDQQAGQSGLQGQNETSQPAVPEQPSGVQEQTANPGAAEVQDASPQASENPAQGAETGMGSNEGAGSSGENNEPPVNQPSVNEPAGTSNQAPNELVLMMNSANMYHNGKHYKAAQPMAVKNGVSYVSIRAMVERAGLKLTYDYGTKETIIYKDGSELRFKTDSSRYKVNGETRVMKGPAYQYKNTFMVPLTSITQALGIPYQVKQAEKKVVLDLSGLGNSDSTPPGSGSGSDGGGSSQPPVNNERGLILMMNSAKMYHNGQLYTAAQPMAVKNGVSYVAIRSLVNRVGLKISYDSRTKETVIIRGSDELRFKTNSKIYTVNGVKKTMKGPAYQYKNTFMVPLTSITQALNISYKVDQPNKRIILNVSTKPIAGFTVANKEIFAGQTNVTYRTSGYSPAGLPIVNERWEGRQEMFQNPGWYTVRYYVQDSSGQWSDPYTQTLEVLKPNEPPTAMFVTDRDEYKMGEIITYTDQSTDDENAIIKREWDNNAKAFFTPGPVTVRLTVTDKHGASSYHEKTIVITGETLYTREEFDMLYTEAGETYRFDGSTVPGLPLVNYTRTSEPRTLIRSNSPETVYREGIVYRETSAGATRFMLHHRNSTGRKVKMYVVATNPHATAASLTTEYVGMGGPSIYPNVTGRVSVENYYESLQSTNAYKTVWIQPGASRVILTELSAVSLLDQQVVSLYADVYSNSQLRYDIILLEEGKDPVHKLPFLQLQASDGIHNRGTYHDSTRIIESEELLGTSPTRLAIGDKTSDPNLTGYDGITGYETSNAGNFGVLYQIKLNRVAPRTLIAFNPRGGKYTGSIMVNGNIVGAPNTGGVYPPNDASVLYRTGDYEQSVEIWFTAAPGSSLPVNLLIMPLPAHKQ